MSDLNRFRPGSRKQAVWEVYATKGLQAAFEFGLIQGLAANTVKAWHSMWKNLGDAPQDAKLPKTAKASKGRAAKATVKLGVQQNEKVQPSKPKAAPTLVDGMTAKAIAAKTYIKTTKRQIKVSYSKKIAYLVKQGPQQSIVMWDHDGSEQCISNKFLGLPDERREPTSVRRYDI